MALWAIVLAGGEGSRLERQIAEWFDDPWPKQFCTFCGTRSMLSHTLDRVARIVDTDRIVTVVSRRHACLVDDDLPGQFIEQPEPRGTASGCFCAIAEILAVDPEATAIILPCDHFVHPEHVFVRQIHRMIRLAQYFPAKLILAGTEADRPETDYGWVQTGEPFDCTVDPDYGAREIVSFHEKPSQVEAEAWWKSGYYWNAMIVAVRLQTLWNMGWQLTPQVVYGFNQYLKVLSGIQEGVVPDDERDMFRALVYENIPHSDLSRDILSRAPGRAVFVPLKGFYWSDWGRPERILETLDRFNLEPNFQRVPEAATQAKSA